MASRSPLTGPGGPMGVQDGAKSCGHLGPGTPLATPDTSPAARVWSCPRCTLINAQAARLCDACELPRPGGAAGAGEASAPAAPAQPEPRGDEQLVFSRPLRLAGQSTMEISSSSDSSQSSSSSGSCASSPSPRRSDAASSQPPALRAGGAAGGAQGGAPGGRPRATGRSARAKASRYPSQGMGTRRRARARQRTHTHAHTPLLVSGCPPSPPP